MEFSTYSHCGGADVVPREAQDDIGAIIKAIKVQVKRKAARDIRDAFLDGLKQHGWSGEVPVARGLKITITSMKDQVGLCLQTGNMARMYADLMKLQTLYIDGAIQSAALVLPSKPMSKALGDNIAHSARLESELPVFRKAHTVPMLVYTLE